ncbi:MAG: HAD family hydrolase [Deltaproteobacteria bacterium]|nr:HAD family hydrolase [Deltaproteobacteria bacterium]
MIRAVITDMDNTLYSWVDYIVPSLEAMVDSLCRTTGYPRIRVVQALKEVYERYESNEYPFAIQESKLFQEFPDFNSFNNLIITPAREAFSAARRKYLVPYAHVIETLEALKKLGVPVIALTDAPRNPAERRALKMKLDQHLAAIYTLPAFPFPDTGVGKDILERESAGGAKLACPIVELPREFEKPDPRGYLRICADFGVDPKETMFVGDSLPKDVPLAQSVGALDVWAEYGTYVSAEYRERLAVISAASAMRRHLQHAPNKDRKPPRVRLSGFDQVLQVVQESRARVSAVA